jgi:hypothetical protein
MPDYFKRSAHPRRLKSGVMTHVSECWPELRGRKPKQKRSYRSPCERCGAQIVHVHMPNGGWGHFEGAKGLTRIKHPCFSVGEGISEVRDERTLDLFPAESEGRPLPSQC